MPRKKSPVPTPKHVAEPFTCAECDNPKPLYKDGICQECWDAWQEWMDHLAADGVSEEK